MKFKKQVQSLFIFILFGFTVDYITAMDPDQSMLQSQPPVRPRPYHIIKLFKQSTLCRKFSENDRRRMFEEATSDFISSTPQNYNAKQLSDIMWWLSVVKRQGDITIPDNLLSKWFSYNHVYLNPRINFYTLSSTVLGLTRISGNFSQDQCIEFVMTLLPPLSEKLPTANGKELVETIHSFAQLQIQILPDFCEQWFYTSCW